MSRILIAGGYGSFGRRAAERLARRSDFNIVVAGRSETEAQRFAETLSLPGRARVVGAALDVTEVTASRLRDLGASVVVNASGPFQTQDYALARACIEAGCHYIDLADARAFVTGISALHRDALAANVLAVSGASSVPGLSSAVVRHFAGLFAVIETIEIGICPGNRFQPGEATTASVLSGAGRPIVSRTGGRDVTVYGWQTLSRQRFGALGSRWLANVDVPDLDLFPQRYPDLRTIRFRAGVEIGAFVFSLWGLSWLVRGGIVRRPERLARPLLALKRRLGFLGTDHGGMFMQIDGLTAANERKSVRWTLIARDGHGPYVPVTGAVILAEKLIDGRESRRGAMPCFEVFTLEDFETETRDLAFAYETVG